MKFEANKRSVMIGMLALVSACTSVFAGRPENFGSPECSGIEAAYFREFLSLSPEALYERDAQIHARAAIDQARLKEAKDLLKSSVERQKTILAKQLLPVLTEKNEIDAGFLHSRNRYAHYSATLYESSSWIEALQKRIGAESDLVARGADSELGKFAQPFLDLTDHGFDSVLIGVFDRVTKNQTLIRDEFEPSPQEPRKHVVRAQWPNLDFKLRHIWLELSIEHEPTQSVVSLCSVLFEPGAKIDPILKQCEKLTINAKSWKMVTVPATGTATQVQPSESRKNYLIGLLAKRNPRLDTAYRNCLAREKRDFPKEFIPNDASPELEKVLPDAVAAQGASSDDVTTLNQTLPPGALIH